MLILWQLLIVEIKKKLFRLFYRSTGSIRNFKCSFLFQHILEEFYTFFRFWLYLSKVPRQKKFWKFNNSVVKNYKIDLYKVYAQIHSTQRVKCNIWTYQMMMYSVIIIAWYFSQMKIFSEVSQSALNHSYNIYNWLGLRHMYRIILESFLKIIK